MIYSQTITWYTDHLPMHNGLYLCKIADSGGNVRFTFIQWENGCGWRSDNDWPSPHKVLAWADGLQDGTVSLPPEKETPWCVGKPPREGGYLCRVSDKNGAIWEENLFWNGSLWDNDHEECVGKVIGWLPLSYR